MMHLTSEVPQMFQELRLRRKVTFSGKFPERLKGLEMGSKCPESEKYEALKWESSLGEQAGGGAQHTPEEP